jgi:3D (Asp-Asp-Asp) domain-containing protein
MENGETVLEETSAEKILSEPVNERREYGTKVNVQTLDTPDGPIEYYRAVTVYATSYSPCRSGTSSCITGTSSGRKVEKGVIAVTSAWYNQFGGQSVYVPGYGKAVIADVGGGIPGRRWIDLAYSDDDFEGWSGETTLYFLTPVPANMVWVMQ